MNISEMIEVLQAAKRGEIIESKHKASDHWEYVITPHWDFMAKDYRIAPKKEPKLVPHWPALFVRQGTGIVYLSDSLFAEPPITALRLATELPPIMLGVKE